MSCLSFKSTGINDYCGICGVPKYRHGDSYDNDLLPTGTALRVIEPGLIRVVREIYYQGPAGWVKDTIEGSRIMVATQTLNGYQVSSKSKIWDRDPDLVEKIKKVINSAQRP